MFRQKLKSLFVGILMLTCAVPAVSAKKVIESDTITLLSFNDFHGYFVPDGYAPGASALVQSILDLKKSSPNTLVIAGGDNFSGSFFSKVTQGEPLPEMFRLLDVQLSAVGNHEFDWGKDYLKNEASEAVDYIAANIEEETNCGRPWLQPYKIVTQTLRNGTPFRIAFIGLSTVETKYKTSAKNVEGLNFEHPFAAAGIQMAYNLKHEGKIDMIVLVAHIGTDMRVPERFLECNSQMLPYLDGVDAIITAHSHKVVLDKINNIPIIQAGSYGRYIGKLQFKVSPIRKSDAFHLEYIGGDTILTDANKQNPEMKALVDRYMKQYNFDEHLSETDTDLIHDSNINWGEYTPVGSLVTASYVKCFIDKMPTDSCCLPIIGVNHAGGIRSSLYKGEINRLCAANVLPFAGNIVAYHFSGKMLKKLLNDGRVNPNGLLQTSYLTLHLDGNLIDRIEYTREGVKREIKDEDPCVVVLDTYITDGGDEYDSHLFCSPITLFNQQEIKTTDAFVRYLRSIPLIHMTEIPIPVLVR